MATKSIANDETRSGSRMADIKNGTAITTAAPAISR